MSKTKKIFCYRLFFLAISSVGSLAFGAFKESVTTTITLNLVNTFSGDISLDGPFLMSGTTHSISGNVVPITFSATATSTYELHEGAYMILTGNGTEEYVHHRVFTGLTEGDHVFKAYFHRGDEVVIVPPLHVRVDTTPPPTPSLIVPSFRQHIENGTPQLVRESQGDTGTAISFYTVFISTSPSFSSFLSITTPQTSLSLSGIDAGTWYRYVTSSDAIGNHSSSTVSQFSLGNTPLSRGGIKQKYDFFAPSDSLEDMLRSLTPKSSFPHGSPTNQPTPNTLHPSPRVPVLSPEDIDTLLEPLEELVSEPPYDLLANPLGSLRQKLIYAANFASHNGLHITSHDQLHDLTVYMEHLCIQEEAMLLAAISPELCNDKEILMIVIDTTQHALAGVILGIYLLGYDSELQQTYRNQIHTMQKKYGQIRFRFL